LCLAGLPLKEEDDDADTYNSGNELILLDPYYVFDRYMDKEDKGEGEGRPWVKFFRSKI
jgi:hypothetical protein